MDELKPCPFCKTEAQRFAKTTFPPGMVSPMCHCFDVPFEDAGYSPEVWNTRPIEDELRAEVERLREALETIKRGKYYAIVEPGKYITTRPLAELMQETAENALKGNG